MKKILYLTDLTYPAKGRRYCDEDIYITDRLKEHFDLVLCHPKCAESFENDVDLIVFRNTGAVIGYKEIYDAFVERVHSKHLRTFNTFDGKADMAGKQYLLDLTREGYPVIPTIDSPADMALLPQQDRYVVKPKLGADSIGLEVVSREEVRGRFADDRSMLVQPAIDFAYEVSFYYIDGKFEYAMYAPDTAKRWALTEYRASSEDLDFAGRFVAWNSMEHGIQRVDACRTKDGRLLLVELEDLNPYLSLLELDEETRDRFIHDLIDTLNDIAGD